jgi:hypothetical protein
MSISTKTLKTIIVNSLKILKNRIGSKNINTCCIVCQKLCVTAYESTIKATNNFLVRKETHGKGIKQAGIIR